MANGSDHAKSNRFIRKKGNFSGLRQFLNINWEEQLKNMNVNQNWEAIKSFILEIRDRCIPKCWRNTLQKTWAPWINVTMKDKIKVKPDGVFIQSESEDRLQIFAKLRNRVRWETRKAVQGNEKNIAENLKTNPKHVAFADDYRHLLSEALY